MSSTAQVLQILADLGGFAGIAAMITAVPTLFKIRRDTAATVNQVKPSHGGNLSASMNKIETDMKELRAEYRSGISSIGHQVGEIRGDMRDLRADIQTLQAKEILK